MTRDASGREDLLVSIESTEPSSPGALGHYRELLKRKLGVEVNVEIVAPTSLAKLTGVESRQKAIRLIDRR